MNIGTIKSFCWIAVLVLGSYLSWEVYDFYTVGKQQLKNLPSEVQREVLSGVEAPKVEGRWIVPYPRVTETFWDLNWTGKMPEVIVETTTEPTEPVAVPIVPVSDLLTVVLINFSSIADLSNISVHYKSSAGERLMMANPEAVLRVGDHLPGKFSYIYVSSILPEYVEFSFEVEDGDEERKPEPVLPPQYETRDGEGVSIARVDETGKVLMPKNTSLIPLSAEKPVINYRDTWEVRKNQFVIGVNDAEKFSQNYSSILSREIRTDSYRDPNTGRKVGVQIKSISSGSIVSKHGFKAGDIIKSINGDPVTSTQEAIKYVKTHADVTTHWEAVIERQGKDITLTYDYNAPTN